MFSISEENLIELNFSVLTAICDNDSISYKIICNNSRYFIIYCYIIDKRW
jgi:hypothetical protein